MARNEFESKALPSAAFIEQVGAIREGAFCVRTASFTADFGMPEEDSEKARISLIHRHRRLTATLSLAAVLGMMAVPIVPGDAYGAKLEVGQGQTSVVTDAQSSGVSVSGGGIINVNSGGSLIGSGGPTASAILVGPGGTININSGGSAVGSAWQDFVASGASARVNVNSSGYAGMVVGVGGAEINVSDGGKVTDGSVASGGVANLYDGAVVSKFGVQDGGELNLFEGATYSSGGGVNSGGKMNISGGSADMLSINGGTVVMQDGAITNGEVMSDGSWVVSEGDVSGAAVWNGGTMDIYGGDVSAYMVGSSGGSSGGVMNVSGGTVHNGAIANGGVMNVYGGLVSGSGMIDSGGLMNVSGGTVQDYTVGENGSMVVTDGTLSKIYIAENGTQNISGGNMTNYVVSSGGEQNVSGGALVSGTILGSQNVYSGTVTSVNIGSGGVQNVSGGTVNAFTVQASGAVLVTGGELASGLVSGANASMTLSGGTATGLSLVSGGAATVSAGGTLADMKLWGGGSAVFENSGILGGANNTLGDGGELSGTVTMKDAATVLTILAQQSAMDVEAEIKGAGQITLNGGNSATMSGNNSGFSGVFDVISGALIGSAANALGSGALIRAASGASVQYSAAHTVRGLEGAGSQVVSAGDLTVALDDAPHVMDGKLEVTNGGIIIKGGTAGTGAQVLNHSANVVSGAVNLNSGGVLIIGDSATNSAAAIEVSGTSGVVATGSGTLFGGFGNVSGSSVTINSGAALAPGYAATGAEGAGGTLTITGDLKMDGGVVAANVGADSDGSLVKDTVNVTGSATVKNTTFDIGVVGNGAEVMAAISKNSGSLGAVIDDSDHTVDYSGGGNTVEFDSLILEGNFDPETGAIKANVKDVTKIDGLSVSDNREAVYGGLNGNNALLGAVMDVAGDLGGLSRALDSLTGEVYGAVAAQAQTAQFGMARRMLGRLASFHNFGYAPPAGEADGPHNLWFSLGASSGSIDGDNKAGTAEADVKQVDASLGYHHALDNGWGVGAALQFGFGEVDVDDRWSQSDIDSLGFTLYGTKAVATGMGDLRFTLGGNYTNYTVDADRWAQLAVPQHLTGHQTGDGYSLFAEAAHRFQVAEGLESRVFLEPFLGLQYNYLKMDSMTENGGSAALSIDADKVDNFSSDLGLRLVSDVNETVSLNGSLSWAHNFGDTETWTDTRFVGGGEAFRVRGQSASENELNVGLGATFHLSEGAGISVGYDGALGDNSSIHGGRAALEIRW